MLLEITGEVFGIVEANFVRNFGNRQLALFQQLSGTLKPDGANEFQG